MTTMARGILDDLRRLPSTDKLQIIDELWQSIPPDDIPVADSVLDEMDRRFADFIENPDRAASWPDVEQRIREKLRA